jgi:hypothetical protein
MTPPWKSEAVALTATVRTKTISAVERAKATPQRMAKRHGTLWSLCGLAGIKASMVAQ